MTRLSTIAAFDVANEVMQNNARMALDEVGDVALSVKSGKGYASMIAHWQREFAFSFNKQGVSVTWYKRMVQIKYPDCTSLSRISNADGISRCGNGTCTTSISESLAE